MEERALYRAILAAPHDDALRLAYADWLDENADELPLPGGERGRAEFIRRQCATARATPSGWQTPGRGPFPSPRERRLLFHHARKWRRAFSVLESSAPFDRGFLRPYRALIPQRFLDVPAFGTYWPFQALPFRSPARRYVPEEDGPFAACPLWDVHLYAPDWHNDPLADRGQYGELLADVARNPGLRQIGWLKLSFRRTPVLDFLRTGDFANVETLVLNSGPFPAVLEAVAENESFRSLRYIQFGTDRWAWAANALALAQYYALESRLRPLNQQHLPFGAMRTALRGVLQGGPLSLTPDEVLPPAEWRQHLASGWLSRPTPEEELRLNRIGAAIGLVVTAFLFVLAFAFSGNKKPPTLPTVPVRQPILPPDFKIPEYEPLVVPEFKPFTPFNPLKQRWELDEALRKWREAQPDAPPGTLPPKRLPVAPPPRPVEPKAAPEVPDEK